ncbi:Inner membrane protein [Kosakonia sp. BK9b]
MMKYAIRLFFLYLFLAVTIIAWSSVDESMNIKVHFEYQKF